jgi:hypothetical protein
MPTKPASAPKPSFPAGLFLMAGLFAMLGWGGVAAVIFLTLPFLGPRWVFFFSLFVAFTGTALPAVWYLNRRFVAERFPAESVLVREAIEAASLGVFLVWLQAGRMFTPNQGWIFFGAFLASNRRSHNSLKRIWQEPMKNSRRIDSPPLTIR